MAPIPPAIRAAGCVGIVAARFDDVDALGLLDVLGPLAP